MAEDKKEGKASSEKGKKDVLRQYVEAAISKGIPLDDLRKNLIKRTWPKKIVDNILEPYTIASKQAKGAALIKFRGISKKFRDNVVLNNVNFDINEGEIFGIIGLSGSGKSTLLNILIGFLQPDIGDVFFKSWEKKKYISVFKAGTEVKTRFGFSSQDPSFYDQLTSTENLEHFGTLYNLPKQVITANINSLLKMANLEAGRDTLSQNLSGGMQRRLGMACSLIHNPKLLILDEPTADLDPLLRKEMAKLIKRVNKGGTTIILASHFLEELEDLCTRIGVLHKGTIVDVGRKEELKEKYSKNDEVMFALHSGKHSRILKELQKRKLNITQIVSRDHKVVIYTPNAEEVLHNLLDVVEEFNEKLIEVELNKPSLREVFEHLVKR